MGNHGIEGVSAMGRYGNEAGQKRAGREKKFSSGAQLHGLNIKQFKTFVEWVGNLTIFIFIVQARCGQTHA
jgi:hypothetical protein